VTGDVLSGKPATDALIAHMSADDDCVPGLIELLQGCIELYQTGDPTAVQRAAVTYTTEFDAEILRMRGEKS
jgi:hypothetical protein